MFHFEEGVGGTYEPHFARQRSGRGVRLGRDVVMDRSWRVRRNSFTSTSPVHWRQGFPHPGHTREATREGGGEVHRAGVRGGSLRLKGPGR